MPTEVALGQWMQERFGIALQTISSPVGLRIEDLVGVAARRNPRRAHLLVSTVLGKHVPVDPATVIVTGRLLGELVAAALGIGGQTDLELPADVAVRRGDPRPLLGTLDSARDGRPVTPVAVLGFAETATGLGHLVAEQLVAECYLHSTRRQVPGVPVAGAFEEGHSHATSHLLLPIPVGLVDRADALVLVDDELSTGETAMGTIRAVHARYRRARYVLASLIDLRSPQDEARMHELAAELGCRIDVVSLVRGVVTLPVGLTDLVAQQMSDLDAADVGVGLRSVPGPAVLDTVWIPWPATVPDGGRHGFRAADEEAFRAAVQRAVGVLGPAVRGALDGGRRGGRVLIVGTEEFMYLPLQLAQALRAEPELTVTFQSTTRSPVFALDAPGYPVRQQFTFDGSEGEAGGARFLYNVQSVQPERSTPDLVVVVTDAAGESPAWHGDTGPLAALHAAGHLVLPVVLAATDPAGLRTARATELPPPLVGPSFGSYAATEVRWLLTDLSDLDLEADVAERESAIQAGTAHYAESLPVEFQPDAAYQDLFDQVLTNSTDRLALAVGLVTELLLSERGHDIVLASLARAGTPIGILMKRWAGFRHSLDLPHYALSIVRGRGIDTVALEYLARHHDPSAVVFVDGWTGKGAIANELTAALTAVREEFGWNFNDDLAVLADPGYCVRTFGTRDDFLIASACLNSTVSGLVSRTVLNPVYLRPDQFHGAKFYRQLADADVSNVLLDAVSASFEAVAEEVDRQLPGLATSNREPTFAGWRSIEAIRAEFGIESVNFVKPGVGETTRVLLRRVPWRILVREADNPDHQHLRLLAAQRDVPVEVRPDLPYSCVGLIRRMSSSEPGEG